MLATINSVLVLHHYTFVEFPEANKAVALLVYQAYQLHPRLLHLCGVVALVPVYLAYQFLLLALAQT
jgi:hypothetical protein